MLLITFIKAQSTDCSNCLYLKGSGYSSECSNSPNCKAYHMSTSNRTIDCGEIVSFYIIYQNGTCENKTSVGCSKKVISETLECVDNCPSDTWELGDYCYYTLSNTMEGTELPFRTCKCIYNYEKKEDIGHRVKYTCKEQNSNCDSKYYDGDTNECIDSSKCTNKYIKYIDENKIRCSTKCSNEEYAFKNNKTCVDEGECNAYKYKSLEGIQYCTEECNYYIKGENECVNDCGALDIRYTEKGKECFNSTTTTGLYKYKDIYFNNCSDTKKLFGEVTTYNYSTGNEFICVEDCSSYGKFLGPNGCIDNCTFSSQKYFYKKICLEKCDNSTYTINITYDGKNLIDANKYPDPYECLDKCPTGTYTDEDSKQCLIASCPNDKFIYPNNSCIETCENDFTYEETITLDVEPEGEASTIDVVKKYCSSFCPREFPYYHYKFKICENTTCISRKLYSAFENPYVCYNSCSEIGSEYKYENDYICYKTQIVCDKPYFYIDENGNEICSTYNECKQKQFKYIKNKQCIKKCNDTDFSFPGVDELGECFSSPEECANKNYLFYNHTDKICKKECELYKTSRTSPTKSKKNDTCFSSYEDCPDSHPFYDETEKLCLERCPKFYLGKKCFDNCEQSEKKYHFDGEYECIQGCKKDGKFYYMNSTDKVCYYSCPETQPFVNITSDIQNEPYNCIKECPPEKSYYYKDKKICTDACDILFHSNNTDDKICVTQCQSGQKVYDKYCVDSCPGIAPLIVKEKLSDIYNNIIVDKCVNKCPTGYPLISKLNNTCLKECPITESYKYDGYCYQKCPIGTFPDDVEKTCLDNGCPARFKYYENTTTGDIKCKTSCPSNKFGLINGGECLDNCTRDFNYIVGNNLCSNNCSIYGDYYEKKEIVKVSGGNYTIYKCVQSCGDKLRSYNEKECISKCPDNYYKAMNNICYKYCNLSVEYPFSTINDKRELICDKKCHTSQKNYGTDKICKSNCSDSPGGTITDYDGACVSKCTNPFYSYLEDSKCVNKCSDTKYITKDKECVDQCSYPNYYREGNECRDKCESNHYSKEIMSENGTIIGYECLLECDSEDYYYQSGSKACLKGCEKDDFIIEKSKICVKSCPSSYKKYFYDGANNNTVYKNNTCVSECPNDKPLYDQSSGQCLFECRSPNLYHIEGEINCRAQCPPNYIIDQFECKSSCPGKFIDSKKKNCVPNCESNQYYVPGENICLDQCNSTLYRINGQECVTSCNSTFYLLDDNKCTNICPENKTYTVKIYTIDDDNRDSIPYTCLPECPQGYYYTDEEMLDNMIHVCKSPCNYKNTTTNECLDHCLNYSYYDSENGTCLDSCDDRNFLLKNINDSYYYQCYDKCPNDYPYVNITTGECLKSCDFIDYDNKTCVTECNENQKKFEDDENNIVYCLNDCDTLGLFTYHEACVKVCDKEKYLIENMEKKICECQYLFYINETDNKKECLPPEKKECKEESEYKIRNYGSNECLKSCDGMLSLDGDYCYPKGTNCPINSKLDNETNKCTCIGNYYSKNGSQICLAEGEDCPSTYKYLKGKECVNECNGGYVLLNDNQCLESALVIGSIDTTSTDNIWYYNGTHYHIVTNGCPSDYPYLIEYSKQCVKVCEDDVYYIEDTTSKKCVSSCSGSKIEEYEPNKFRCTCSNKWYMNNTEVICSGNQEKCSDFSPYNKTVKKTNQCVGACPDNYKYEFNDECFSSCDEAKNDYGYNIKNKTGSNEFVCICENLWITNDDDKKECITEKFCNNTYYLLIESTKECTNSDTCSSGYKFNGVCYETCPNNTTPNDGTKECDCIGAWYEYTDKVYDKPFKYCLDECPVEFPLKDKNNNNKCVNECGDSQKKFNYECYSACPENTTENGNECKCNTNFLWYQTIENYKIILKCNVDKCPKGKNQINFATNECLTYCNDTQYKYEGKCYDNSCPDNTRSVDEISKECIAILAFDQANNSLTALEGIINGSISEIYHNASEGGIVYNINNSTLQIYGINKNKKEKKDLIMRSNLTYIDFSNCIDKIYNKHIPSGNADLVVVKYDLGNGSDSQNINPVEYKIMNSETGSEIPLDVCGENSIIISYPISSILNKLKSKKNKLRNLEEEETNINDLSLREKFDKGKELSAENEEIDSFNINNILYTDMCYPIEMNGKDLILEDRFNYLYPAHSFCESNCVYNKTDFVYERAICNCSPKTSVNFDRQLKLEQVAVDDKEMKNKQKGSIFKCISKIKIIASFGFFYGLIIILAEIGMAVLTFLYSYRVFMMRIKKKFDTKGLENNYANNNNIDTENVNLSKEQKYNKKKMDEVIKTSERDLVNPPKKDNKLNINDNKNNKNNKSSKNNRKGKREETKKTVVSRKEDKDVEGVINIKKLKINNNEKEEEKEEKIYSSDFEKASYEKSSISTMKDMEDESIFDLIKLEERLLRVDFNYALRKNKAEIIVILLTEILDKIYLIKAIFFLQKYEIFSLYFSLYLLWHFLLLSFLSLFYNNNTLHKIWIENNYPDLNYHLSFGFVVSIIVFIIYKGLSLLINNDKKIKELELVAKENKTELEEKCKKMLFWAQIKIIIFYVIQLILLVIFYLYLITFFATYPGTGSSLVESYGIALIEIVLIKILYGLVLGVLRKISLSFGIKILYTIVVILDTYVS